MPAPRPVKPLARVRRICLALPEAHEKIAWGAPTFRVKDKQFAMYLDNHHGDGRLALWCKAAPGAQEELVGSDARVDARAAAPACRLLLSKDEGDPSMIGKLVPGALLASALLSASATGETWAIDGHVSSLTVHVFKSGLLSAFGDNHVVRATIASGSVVGGDQPAVEIAVDARQMTVLDPDLAPAKRAEVQKRMLGPEVLDVTKFPEVHFRSTAVRPMGEGRWRVEGVLKLHGHSVPLSFEVTGAKERFRGSATVSQRAFGIEPISIAGGTVKVRDDVKVDFEIATVSP